MAVDRSQVGADPDVRAVPQPARRTAYDEWVESIGIPVHKGYFQTDLRTVELGMWEERGCMAAIIELAGQQGFTEGRVTEVPAGESLPPTRFALDEICYVLSGRGLCTIWASENRPKRTFEWQPHSLFMLPRNYTYQLTSTQGGEPARLYHYNTLPIGMHMVPDPAFFFNNPYVDESIVYGGTEEFYSEAKITVTEGAPRASWRGNFFPDMLAWDKLVPFKGRGAGGMVVGIQYPQSTLHNHMSVFDAMTYKKAHRHGPGVQIIIPGGEGYSILWPEVNAEKIIIPWHEGSTFVPPNNWYHQHFNVGGGPARYLAFHAPAAIQSLITAAVVDDPNRQIEYPEEEPFIREKFESEMSQRGLKSIMPEICYQDRNFEWDYGDV